MIRYIFVAAFVYIVFRVVQVVLRILASGARRPEAPGDNRAPAETRPAEKFEDIRDADFEDLPPGKEPGTNKEDREKKNDTPRS